MRVGYVLYRALVINVSKSKLEPEQVGQWLGFTLDLLNGKFFVPKEKIAKLVHSVISALAAGFVPVRLLASIVGQIISMSLAIGPVTQLRTMALYNVVNSRRY